MTETPNEWMETVIKDVVQEVVKKVVKKVQWSHILIPCNNGDNKIIPKNLKQHFMSVIKLKPKLCTTYTERCKNFGKRDRDSDRNGCYHWNLISPS